MPSKIGKIFDFIPVIINSSNGLQRWSERVAFG
jgi:hypothetical protein